MDRSLGALIVGGVLVAQMLVVNANSEQSANPQPELASANAPAKLPALPAAPDGKSTIMGGEIEKLDPVRDQFQLKAFGQRPMTILFDERTQVYLDGKEIPMHNLHPGDNASIQTVLDGTNVFAISIHLLSRAPAGEYQGQVLSYNSDTKELTVNGISASDSVKLLVPIDTPVTRVGQGALSSVRSS